MECTFSNIHQRYQDFVREVLSLKKNPKVLKTDCWNEANEEYPIASLYEDVVSVEIDEKVIRKARKNFPNQKFEAGDIRNLKFPDKSFDVVLDLSTIDHVREYHTVLSEYQRILKNSGLLLLVVWASADGGPWQIKTKEGFQYYFPQEELSQAVRDRFIILEVEKVLKDNHGELWKFILVRR